MEEERAKMEEGREEKEEEEAKEDREDEKFEERGSSISSCDVMELVHGKARRQRNSCHVQTVCCAGAAATVTLLLSYTTKLEGNPCVLRWRSLKSVIMTKYRHDACNVRDGEVLIPTCKTTSVCWTFSRWLLNNLGSQQRS